MQVITKAREGKCVAINRGLLKALAIAQLGLAGVLALFSAVIDPPPLINMLVAVTVLGVEGTAVGVMVRYLRSGCLAQPPGNGDY